MIATKLKYKNLTFWISKDLKRSLRGSSIPLKTPRFSTSFDRSRVWRTAFWQRANVCSHEAKGF